MKTDDLIARLSDEPLRSRPVEATLALALAGGALVALAAMLLWLQVRPDIARAVTTNAFWLKLAYAAALAALSFPVVVRLTRPDGLAGRMSIAIIAAPILMLLGLALYQLAQAPPGGALHLVMGASASVCSLRIVALSTPVLAALFLSIRTLAPTRLFSAGAAAGILAGAAGTLVYALHCDESAAPFVVIWYTLGIAAVGMLGGLLGRTLLRW
jgi:hypothetical protein